MKTRLKFPTPEQIGGVPVKAPVVYVREEPTWEYKLLFRNLAETQAPTEEELNSLGKEGWELVGVVGLGSVAHFYFKRPAK